MYESVFWSSCAASHDDWSISTVANYIMLKNTWCSSDFYAKILWDWNLRRTRREGITEIFCFESVWCIPKQFVELGCCVLLNIESEPFVKCCGIFGTGSIVSWLFLTATPTSALSNQGCVAVSPLTYCCAGSWEKAWTERLSLDIWDKLISNWVRPKYFALVQLVEIKCFNSGIPNHFILKSKVWK